MGSCVNELVRELILQSQRNIAEYLKKVQRPKGRPQRTWMELIKHDLKAIVILDYNKPNKIIKLLTQKTHDIHYWRYIVRRVVLQK